MPWTRRQVLLLVAGLVLGISWLGPITTPYFIGLGVLASRWLGRTYIEGEERHRVEERFCGILQDFTAVYRREPNAIWALEQTPVKGFEHAFKVALNTFYAGSSRHMVFKSLAEALDFPAGRQFSNILYLAGWGSYNTTPAIQALEKLLTRLRQAKSLRAEVQVSLAALQLRTTIVLTLGAGVLAIASRVNAIHAAYSSLAGQVVLVVGVSISALGAWVIYRAASQMRSIT